MGINMKKIERSAQGEKNKQKLKELLIEWANISKKLFDFAIATQTFINQPTAKFLPVKGYYRVLMDIGPDRFLGSKTISLAQHQLLQKQQQQVQIQNIINRFPKENFKDHEKIINDLKNKKILPEFDENKIPIKEDDDS